MIISPFSGPPRCCLMGAVLPVAHRIKLPAIRAAMAMNLFGHGIALSGDFIIQGAPKLTADGAGIPVSEVISASIPLVIVMGVVTTIAAFIFLRRDMKKGNIPMESKFDLNQNSVNENNDKERVVLSKTARRFFAILIPLLFAAELVRMSVLKLQGGDATALIGGTSIDPNTFIHVSHKEKGLKRHIS